MKNRRTLGQLAAAILIAVITTILGYFNVMGNWDSTVSDRLNQKSSAVNHNIFIIGIDDATLEKYGAITSWGRELSGKLIERLTENPDTKPAVVGMDIIYSETMDKEGDEYFAKVCKEAGNVVTAETFVFKGQPQKGDDGKNFYNPYYVDYVIHPYEKLRKSTESGFVNTIIDNDGYVRETMAEIDYEGETKYSFAAQIYKKYQESRNEKVVFPKTYGKNKMFFFSYSGKPGKYTVISMADVLDGTVDTKIFKDAVVLVGAYAVGMQDSFKPAIAHDSQMYGVEIHANIVQALLEGKTQIPFSRMVYALLTGILCAICYLLVNRIGILWSTVLSAGIVLGNMIGVRFAYSQGYVLPFLLLPVVIVVIYMMQLILGYLTEYARRKRVVDVFKQYVAPQVVDKISRDKDFELVLGGENRHIAVLFVDIRGFTTMSERLNPEQVVEILNEYLSLTTKAIFKYSGTLDKFVGDATMAVFNAPFDLEDYVFRAVCAAWDMKMGADAIAEKFKLRFGKDVAFGIGINCGSAVVGNIGCDFRMDYTAIGDTVNTAARLESNAAPGQILISESVYEAVKDRVEVTPIGESFFKGKSQSVFVYQLDDVMREEAGEKYE